MTNELMNTNQQSLELINAKQEAEILKLKFELQKIQAQKASRLEDSLFSPNLFPHYTKVAETLSKSSVIPTAYRNKPEDIFVAMAMGYQLGFPVEQALQDIAVINGRPCLWGDGLLALVLNHPECEGIQEEPIYSGQVITGYICTVKRKGHQPHSKPYTVDDAMKAGLLKKGGAWSTSESRMLQLRARAFAVRDKFADALRGLRQAEVEIDEPETIIEGEVVKNTSENQTEKLKLRLQNNATVAPTNDSFANPKAPESDSVGNQPITDKYKQEIEKRMTDLGFDDERKKKALDYFKVDSLDRLTNKEASVFILQLSKAKAKDAE
jgi:hypothetical protein